MDFKRRQLLQTALLGAGSLGLRALATGLPIHVLADPLRAQAQEPADSHILILNTSHAGEPINCNAPGTYDISGVAHPAQADVAPTDVQLGGQTYTAAKTWADLGESILSRTTCIHHGTYTGIHARQSKVMRLMGSTNRSEMFPSIFAKHLGPLLGTTQVEPMSLGALAGQELLSFDGRTLSNVAPTSLKQVLGQPEGPLGSLHKLRDRDLDRIWALYKEHGSVNQRRMVDLFASSHSELRGLSLSLLEQLDAISEDRDDNQIIAAPVLAAMKLSPVITVHIPFGGDNHFDDRLATEAEQHVIGFGQVRQLIETLDTFRAQDILKTPVTFATLGVFGRTLGGSGNGRAHNSRHHVALVIGDNIRSGVIGGCAKFGEDFGSLAIDKNTGAGVPLEMTGPDVIPFEQSLESTAKTLGVALGIPRDYLDTEITTGQVIEAALS